MSVILYLFSESPYKPFGDIHNEVILNLLASILLLIRVYDRNASKKVKVYTELVIFGEQK